MDEHVHTWRYQGVVFLNTGRQRPGSGATSILYFSTFYCESCREMQHDQLDYAGNSYQDVRFNAAPMDGASSHKWHKANPRPW